MSTPKVEKLVEQIKLNQSKGLFLVENLSPNLAQAVAEKIGVIIETKIKDDKLVVRTYTSRESDLTDSSMLRILNTFDELEPEGERIVEGGEDIYLLDFKRGYELVLDEDSYVQQQVPILADLAILDAIKQLGAKSWQPSKL